KRDGRHDQRSRLERLRHYLREDEPRLERIVQNPRDYLARLGAREVREREPRKVLVDGVPQIARYIFLQLRAEPTTHPDEHVLRDHHDHHDEDDVPERAHLVAAHHQLSDGGVQKTGYPSCLYVQRRTVEQRVEERNEQRNREGIQQCCADVGGDGSDHPPRVRLEERKQPSIYGDSSTPSLFRRTNANRRGGRLYSCRH